MRTRAALSVAVTLLVGSASAGQVLAQAACRVTDPTGTPLNVRTAPQGRVIGQVENGRLVRVIDRSADRGGRSWVYIADARSGEPIGWVFREFVSCFR